MLMSGNITNISGAILTAQRSMGEAKKDSTNPYFRSSYADLNSIREVALPALNAAGISVLQPTVSIDGRNYVRTLLIHESGEWLASDTEIVAAKANDPQAYGSGISYARRYGLQSMLNIGAVDDDGERAMVRAPKTPELALAPTPSQAGSTDGVPNDNTSATPTEASNSRRRPSPFKFPKQASGGGFD